MEQERPGELLLPEPQDPLVWSLRWKRAFPAAHPAVVSRTLLPVAKPREAHLVVRRTKAARSLGLPATSWSSTVAGPT